MNLLPWPWALACMLAGLALGWRLRDRLGMTPTPVPVREVLRGTPWLGALLVVGTLAVTQEAVYERDVWLEWFWPDAMLVWTIPVCRAVLFLTLALMVGLIVADRRPRAGLVGSVALLACLWFNGLGRPVSLGPTRMVDGVILQSTGSTCMPASGANVARRLGMNVSEGQVAALMGTTEAGTTVGQAVYGLTRLGLRCVRRRTANLHDVRAPAILLVGAGEEDHAVAFIGWQGLRAEIWDPSRGRRLMSDKQLSLWTWHGHAIEVLATMR